MNDPRTEGDLDRRCPECGAWLPGGERGTPCPSCGGAIPSSGPARHPIWAGLAWLAGAYRIWSLGVFALALYHLVRLGDAGSYFLLFMVVFPFGMALALSCWMPGPPNRWLVAFLLLVDVGVILGPEHRILPMLHQIRALPETQSRILTWYFLVYATLQYGIMPPVGFGRSLRTAWRGGRPTLRPGICVFGLALWGFVASLLTYGVITSWR